ncbi:hypothetical protein K502DRAFT_365834 [Neoconidiobolus thromboides FSU 785]|nr:hypothetical protein K502DRAFT_365834 [Neoconidiobolus thromboides FSU 785]
MFKKRAINRTNIRKKSVDIDTLKKEESNGELNEIKESKNDIEIEAEDAITREKFEDLTIEINNVKIDQIDSNSKKRQKDKTKTVFSFEDEETAEPEFQQKKSKNSRNIKKLYFGQLEGLEDKADNHIVENSYSLENLEKLKQEQNELNNEAIKNLNRINELEDFSEFKETFIPDQNEVLLAKRQREKKRTEVIDEEEEDPFLTKEFIGLEEDNNDIHKELKSGLVREEDEFGDGAEELESILGPNIKLRKGDMKEALLKEEKKEISQAIQEMDFNDNDDLEFTEFEMMHLNRAIGDPKIKQKLKEIQEAKLKSKQHNIKAMPIPSLDDISDQLEIEKSNLENSILPYQTSIQNFDDKIAEIQLKLKAMDDKSISLNDRLAKYSLISEELR